MSKKLFTDEEIAILSQHKYVKKVSSKGITYTDEFKRKFIAENQNGKVPRKVLLTDITYLFFNNGQKAYLSTILDAATNEVLAYNLSKSLKIDIVIDTIDNLLSAKHRLHKDVFIHSDQGVHYTIPIFQNKVKQHNMGQSMSRLVTAGTTPHRNRFFVI